MRVNSNCSRIFIERQHSLLSFLKRLVKPTVIVTGGVLLALTVVGEQYWLPVTLLLLAFCFVLIKRHLIFTIITLYFLFNLGVEIFTIEKQLVLPFSHVWISSSLLIF